MSVRTKLILSNIALVVVPVFSIFIVDIILGYFMFVVLNNDANTFAAYRLISIVIVIIAVNLSLSYMLSKHIINPILKLNAYTMMIGEGNLDESVDIKRKDEIGELAQSFEFMRLALKDAEEKEQTYFRNRQELMASMSHDLKTPLTSIKGYVNGIQDGVADTPEKLDRYTSVIQQSVSRLEEMIDDLFMYSKLDLEEVDFNFSAVKLEPLLRDIVGEYKMWFSNSQHINLNYDKNRHVVWADRQQLHRAIANVIDNSIKYSDPWETGISISLWEQDYHSVIEILDNGIGIDEEETDKVFDSFYRTDYSRNSATGGSGLGLTIVKSIIDKHDGEVSLTSEKNEGTSVKFILEQVRR